MTVTRSVPTDVLQAHDSPVVQLRNLSKRYRGGWLFGRAVQALDQVSLDVPPGVVFGLLGPNGAGKTTLVKILLGIVRRSQGSATLFGFPAGDRRGRIRVGYLPENLRLASHQTASSAMEFYGRLSGMSHAEIKRRSPPLLDFVGLTSREHESVKRFSKGMRQRLGLAQALLHNPDLLILDEPTDGLDPVGRADVRKILHQMRDEGRTVFINSHLLQEVELICDHVAIMHQGRVQHAGPLELFLNARDAELDLWLLGEEKEVRTALTGQELRHFGPHPQGGHRILLAISQQSTSDEIVDQLRARQISILALQRRRKSLEDLFLEIVNRPRPTP